VLTTVTSHVSNLPPCQGISVKPSGRLPSCLVRLTGSLVTGVPAEVTAWAMKGKKERKNIYMAPF